MGDSLFQRRPAAKTGPATPYELIENEIDHLKKGKLARHGSKPQKKMSLWLLVVVACGLVWLYVMDPVEHSWYKSEAIKSFVYLHNYGVGKEADQLAASGILAPEEVAQLEERRGSFQGFYPTPQAAAAAARNIVAYMTSVKLLHKGRYEDMDWLGRLRYQLFLRWGLALPTSWNFLDPNLNG